MRLFVDVDAPSEEGERVRGGRGGASAGGAAVVAASLFAHWLRRVAIRRGVGAIRSSRPTGSIGQLSTDRLVPDWRVTANDGQKAGLSPDSQSVRPVRPA